MYDEDDGTTTNSTPPQFPGPSIVAKNSTGAEVFIRLMDIEERNVIARINDVFGKDSNGIPLPWAPIQGAYAKGNICFQNPASPTRAHGDLETGRLLLFSIVWKIFFHSVEKSRKSFPYCGKLYVR
ncbi:MAG: hypothetical protein BWY09_01063 [Candidatus Hydrogenedentes bacterium ADurb.Bin179]|nr:MAG: hypothetical protein BWY09_01063 [Candidatus Hydrogenedentes bacterium ADurb.Bin179]